MKKLIERLKDKFDIRGYKKQKNNLYFIEVGSQKAVSLITYLRNIEDYTHLSLISAVDWEEKGKFQLTYILYNSLQKHSLAIKILIDRSKPTMESIHHLWHQAATYQRELYEMFGIEFMGSPGLKDDFILEDWQEKPPMRRDFKTKEYSEQTYFPRPGRKTHDPEKYMQKKLYPEGDK